MSSIKNYNGKIFNKIFLDFRTKFDSFLNSDSEIEAKTVLKFIIYLMQKAEKQKLDGTSKKDIVISIIKTILSENRQNIQNIECVENFVNIILPKLIDLIISIDRKEVYIKLENSFKKACFSI